MVASNRCRASPVQHSPIPSGHHAIDKIRQHKLAAGRADAAKYGRPANGDHRSAAKRPRHRRRREYGHRAIHHREETSGYRFHLGMARRASGIRHFKFGQATEYARFRYRREITTRNQEIYRRHALAALMASMPAQWSSRLKCWRRPGRGYSPMAA